LVASGEQKEGLIHIQQDVNIFICDLEQGRTVLQVIPEHRYGWLQVLKGKTSFMNVTIEEGDGVAITPSTKFELQAQESARLLFFDLN
jgi:redox-sensitive bicupin YhaK (pirin superfamily)